MAAITELFRKRPQPVHLCPDLERALSALFPGLSDRRLRDIYYLHLPTGNALLRRLPHYIARYASRVVRQSIYWRESVVARRPWHQRGGVCCKPRWLVVASCLLGVFLASQCHSSGLLLRDRSLHNAPAWLGAFLGYMAADLVFGRTLSLAAFFAATNVVGAFTATILLRRLDSRDLALRRVHSVIRILACLIPACFAAAICGALLVRVQFHGSMSQALMTWPASELVNYLIMLPAMLTVGWKDIARRISHSNSINSIGKLGPAVFLIISCAAATIFDGPGSIIFPLPGLLLCALVYSLPVTALSSMLVGTAFLMMLGLGVIDMGQNMAIPYMVVSVRIAVAFLVMVPLTISSAMAVRDDLLGELRKAADHDGLTGLLNRRAFEQRLDTQLAVPLRQGSSLLILWIDIDFFKLINDRHGHPAGDAVLQAFAATARSCCRANDFVGRLGGEEFALVAQVSSADDAQEIANRLREAFAAQTLIWEGAAIRATVSIGACYLNCVHQDMATLIRDLDTALYEAKRNGRNRIEWLEQDISRRDRAIGPRLARA